MPRVAGLKADKGTTTHKALECLACIKKLIQDGQTKGIYQDSQLGPIEYDEQTWMKPHHLSDDEVDAINKTRRNKQTYKSLCKIPYGTVHYGVDLVNELAQKSSDYYAERGAHKWKPVDFKDVKNFTYIPLEYKDGMFDPRRRTIVEAEPHFDITIDKPWANYQYEHQGKILDGQLAIKGTVDLITDIGGGIYEIVDWKTGQRIDWGAKGTPEKTYDKLCEDPQLMLYYYACRNMYPDVKGIILSIFFVRDGGPFSICFDEHHLAHMEKLLEKKFKYTQNCTLPEMCDPNQKDFKCTRICDFYKQKKNDKNMCRFIHDEIKDKGMQHVIDNHTEDGHNVGFYQNPGE